MVRVVSRPTECRLSPARLLWYTSPVARRQSLSHSGYNMLLTVTTVGHLEDYRVTKVIDLATKKAAVTIVSNNPRGEHPAPQKTQHPAPQNTQPSPSPQLVYLGNGWSRRMQRQRCYSWSTAVYCGRAPFFSRRPWSASACRSARLKPASSVRSTSADIV